MEPTTKQLMKYIEDDLSGYFYNVISNYEVRYGKEHGWQYRRKKTEEYQALNEATIQWWRSRDTFDFELFDKLLLQTISGSIMYYTSQLDAAKELLGEVQYEAQLEAWAEFQSNLLAMIEKVLEDKQSKEVH